MPGPALRLALSGRPIDNDLARHGSSPNHHGPTRSAPHRFTRAQGESQRRQLDGADIASIWQTTWN